MKKIKILSVLMVILLAMPGYYRNRQAVDRFAVGMWGGVEGAWLHFAFESKKVGTVFSDAVSGKRTGKSIPSQREAEIEAERASQKQIDEQEQKENGLEESGFGGEIEAHPESAGSTGGERISSEDPEERGSKEGELQRAI